MKAAASSCRTWMKRILSFCLRRASKTPLIPSPGSPNIVSTPHAIKRSTSTSEASGTVHLLSDPFCGRIRHLLVRTQIGLRSLPASKYAGNRNVPGASILCLEDLSDFCDTILLELNARFPFASLAERIPEVARGDLFGNEGGKHHRSRYCALYMA